MAPSLKKVTLERVSIPVHYNIPGLPLFTQNWFKEVAKTDFFWLQIKKYVSKGTLNRRIGLDIRTDIEEVTQVRAQEREVKKPGQHRTPSASVVRECATTTPGPEEEFEPEAESDLISPSQKDNENEAAPKTNGYHLRRRARPARKATSPTVEKVECARCNDFESLSEMSVNKELGLICKSCSVGEADPAANTITITVPRKTIEPPAPQENLGARQALLPEAPVIKMEEEETGDHHRPATASMTTNAKRSRQDEGQVVDIEGERFIVFTDKNGMQRVILHPLQPRKKIKVELNEV